VFEEIKTVAKHFLVYGLGNILSRIVGFILIPVYTHYLTTSEYGTLELLELTTYIAGMFLALGISQSVMRFYYDFEEPQQRNTVVCTALFSIWVISLFGMFWFILFSPGISILVFKSSNNGGLFRLIFLTLTFSLANEIPLSFIRAQQKSVLFTVISLSRLILSLGLNILFIVGFRWGVRGIILSAAITQGINSIFLFFYTIKQTGIHFSWTKLKHMLVYGLPYIPGGLGMFVLNFVDRFFLQRFASLSEVGIYSLGYKFGMIINPLVTDPFFSIWRPKMFELAKKEKAKDIYSIMLTYFLFLEIFLALGISILIKDVLKIISSPEYHSAYKIVPLILLSYILWGGYFHVQVGILLEKKTRNIAYIVALSALSNLILNYFLIPWIGMWGAAISTLSSFGIMFVLNYVISSRVYYVKYEFTRILKLLISAVFLYLISLSISLNSIFLTILLKTSVALSFPFLLFLLRFYTQAELRKMKEIIADTVRFLKLAVLKRG
jgi:O-antigen/teichoic acid export membrane protein